MKPQQVTMLASAPRVSPAPQETTHFHAEAGTMMSSAGTSVFTETCGQVKPLKFSRTVWLY
jgi:hypothetical protein